MDTTQSKYLVDFWLAVSAYFWAVFVGILSGVLLWIFLRDFADGGLVMHRDSFVVSAVASIALLWPIFLIGLPFLTLTLMIGRRLQRSDSRFFISAGIVCSFLVVGILLLPGNSWRFYAGNSPYQLAASLIANGLAGAVAGWIFWRIQRRYAVRARTETAPGPGDTAPSIGSKKPISPG